MNGQSKKVSGFLRWFHLVMVCVWTLLLIPTLMFWSKSILWLALMSAWANIMAHFASYMASRAEQRQLAESNESE